MKLIELLNKIVNGKIKEGTQLKDNSGDIFVFKNNRFVDKNDNFYIYAVVADDEALNDEVEIIEEKQQGRWKPKEGEKYWYTDDEGDVSLSYYFEDRTDNWRYLTKNIFKTEQEAKEYLEYKTALLEAEKPFVEGYDKENWFIVYDLPELKLSWSSSRRHQGVIYLGQDQDVAQAFVDKWYKQILKYEFGIEE